MQGECFSYRPWRIGLQPTESINWRSFLIATLMVSSLDLVDVKCRCHFRHITCHHTTLATVHTPPIIRLPHEQTEKHPWEQWLNLTATLMLSLIIWEPYHRCRHLILGTDLTCCNIMYYVLTCIYPRVESSYTGKRYLHIYVFLLCFVEFN